MEKLLQRTMRYEIYWNIGPEELLHYIVTFNTGQRSMSVPLMLEMVRKPLLEALEQEDKIAIFQRYGECLRAHQAQGRVRGIRPGAGDAGLYRAQPAAAQGGRGRGPAKDSAPDEPLVWATR